MQRLKKNFLSDGIAMTQKFQHLSEGLLYYDPEFYAYLKRHQVSQYWHIDEYRMLVGFSLSVDI